MLNNSKNLNTKVVRNNKGFSILAVILVIVAVIVAIGIWALSGQTNTSNSSPSADVLAGSLQNDGNILKARWNELLIQGIPRNNIDMLPNTASTALRSNVYDPVNGVAIPTVNTNILRSDVVPGTNGEGFWFYSYSFTFPGVGINPGKETNIMIVGIKDSVCQKINQSIYGSPSIPTFNPSLFGRFTNVNPSNNFFSHALAGLAANGSQLTANAPFLGWTSGCLNYNSGTPDYNFYFNVFQIV